MNDVQEAIERVGARFDPPDEGFDHLFRRRNRVRKRRRIAAGAFALTVATGGSLLVVRAFPASRPGPHPQIKVVATWPATSPLTPEAATPGGLSCPTPSVDSPPPVSLSSTSGPAGSSVDVSGMFESGELWLQLWWNADGDKIPDTVAPPPWPLRGPDLQFVPAGPGPVVKLTSVAASEAEGDCSFRAEFTVPDVEPGTYQILWAFGAVEPPPGDTVYGLWVSSVTFEVTD